MLLSIFVGTLAACNMPFVGEEPQEEFMPGEPFPEEQPPEEFHPEEPPPEEQHPEEPPPGEPPHDEPPPGEPPPDEPHPEPPQQQSGGDPGNWSTDVAVTDIYPGNQPTGQFHVRISNHGPGTLKKVKVDVLCGFFSVNKNNGMAGPSDQSNLNLSLSMKPGETQKFPTKLDLDLNTFEYTVGCDIYPGFHDPDQGNNSYTEVFK